MDDVPTPRGHHCGERGGCLARYGGRGVDDQWLGPQRDRHRFAGCRLGLDPDPRQEVPLLVGRQRGAQQPVDPRGPERDPRRPRLVGRGIDPSAGDHAARPFLYELRGAVGADPRQPRLLALLEPAARLGAQREPLGRPPDAHWVEDRRLDGNVSRRVADLRGRAAHDPGDADRAVAVGDQEHLAGELAFDMVQRLEPLPRKRATHDDRGPPVGPGTNGAGVERVDRLTELEHHVVRGVDDVRDRPLAGGEEAHLDAIGRRADGDAADPATDEAGAQVGIVHVDGQPLGRRGALAFLDHDVREPDLATGGRGDLAGQPQDRQRVPAVGLDVHVEHVVAIEVRERHPERRVGREDEDPVAVAGQPQLLARAQHPVRHDAHLLGALDPPVAGQHGTGQGDRDPLPGRDVGCAAHDRQRLAAVAQGHRCERQPVRTRVLLDRQQLAGHDVLPVRAPALDGLDLHPEQRQALGELLRRQVDVDELAQPRHRHPHRKAPRKRRSSSMYSRRSPTACRRFAIRSTPMPNANPW